MESETDQVGGHRFILEKNVEINPDVLADIKAGLSQVWDSEIGREREFKIVINDYVHDKRTGEEIRGSLAAFHLTEKGEFEFGIQALRDDTVSGLSDADKALVVAAHECAHAVQQEQGNPPPTSLENPNYHNDWHEKDAWFKAAKVLKQKYPQASGMLGNSNDNAVDLSKTG